MPSQVKSPQKIWERLSTMLVHSVEGIFFNLGVMVARHPWRIITVTWVFVAFSSIGMFRFYIEKNPMNLWVPPDSDFRQDTNWYIDKFGIGFRLQRLLIVADDVLQPQVIKAIHNITNVVNTHEVKYQSETININDLCYKVPVVNIYDGGKNNEDDLTDNTLWFDDEFYCSFLEEFQMVCLEYNLINLWKNQADLIDNTTKHEIVTKVNTIKTNPMTGHPVDYIKMLGGVKRDESGDVVSANSMLLTWYTQVNMSQVDINEVGNLLGTEDWVTIPLALWESDFLHIMEAISQNVTGMKVYYESGRSFGDISGQAMFQELDKLFMGIALMFFYVVFGLSRCNWLEVKLTLGSVGLLCVGIAYVTAVSWCSIIGIPFGPVHSSLPFLLMGLGVDDMFVMNACWINLSTTESKKSIPVKVGLMLKHAGVSIVITSFTDIVALLIGAITILPSLKSFCIYAAMGVFFIFCYSVTFYVAVFTLDIKRMEANRNGLLFCVQHKKPISVSNEKTTFQKMFSKFYKHVVFTIPGQIIILIFSAVMAGFSIEAIFRLEQRFDPKWFIPEDTYYKDFLTNYDYYYPDEGNAAMVFLGEMDYNTEFSNLYEMTQNLRNQSYVNELVTWVDSFQGYVLKNHGRNMNNISEVSDEEFKSYLSRFLYSPVGARFQINFKFSQQFRCGYPATNITGSSMSFNFPRFNGPSEYLPAMNHVKQLVASTNITTGDGYRSVWSKVFANWVTDEIIGVEVERNIELALLCVMLCTIVLITNLQMCFWIFMCVLLTIINVLGWMQRWGMTVDIVCCIGLELAIGLCVDYAAHVGHTFLTMSDGTRGERSFKTVTSIGSAVLWGGGSTFLSLSLLSMSKAYTFQSFFKIFFLVIIFGLFNGLLFLPVVLALVGPSAYKPKEKKEFSFETVELNSKIEKLSDGVLINSTKEMVTLHYVSSS